MPLARANSISDNAGVRAGSVACLPDPGGKTRLNAVSHKHMARHLTCPRCLSEHISRRLSSGQQPLRTADTSRQIHDSGTSQPRSKCDPGRGRRLHQSHQQLTTASAVGACPCFSSGTRRGTSPGTETSALARDSASSVPDHKVISGQSRSSQSRPSFPPPATRQVRRTSERSLRKGAQLSRLTLQT